MWFRIALPLDYRSRTSISRETTTDLNWKNLLLLFRDNLVQVNLFQGSVRCCMCPITPWNFSIDWLIFRRNWKRRKFWTFWLFNVLLKGVEFLVSVFFFARRKSMHQGASALKMRAPEIHERWKGTATTKSRECRIARNYNSVRESNLLERCDIYYDYERQNGTRASIALKRSEMCLFFVYTEITNASEIRRSMDLYLWYMSTSVVSVAVLLSLFLVWIH